MAWGKRKWKRKRENKGETQRGKAKGRVEKWQVNNAKGNGTGKKEQGHGCRKRKAKVI